MKLEAGKRYVLETGEIEECLAVWVKAHNGYQATVTMGSKHASYTIDGKYWIDYTSPLDIVAEYKEPKKHKATVYLYDDGGSSIDTIRMETHPFRRSPLVVQTRMIEWETIPEPVRVATYLIEADWCCECASKHCRPYKEQTHPIGQQPEGAVLVPGSEREE